MSAYYNRSGRELTINPEVTTVQMKMPRICGRKLSNCCFVISIWGIVMLILLGIFYNVNSVALTEDVPLKEITKDGKKHQVLDYSAVSTNCFIAAGIYGVTLLISAYQKYAISRGMARL